MAWRGRGPLWLGLLALMVAASSGVWLFKAVLSLMQLFCFQKPLPKRIFLHPRCPKWWAPPSNSCTATPEDTKRFFSLFLVMLCVTLTKEQTLPEEQTCRYFSSMPVYCNRNTLTFLSVEIISPLVDSAFKLPKFSVSSNSSSSWWS